MKSTRPKQILTRVVENLLRGVALLAILFALFVARAIWSGGVQELLTDAFVRAAGSYWLLATPIVLLFSLGVAAYDAFRGRGEHSKPPRS